MKKIVSDFVPLAEPPVGYKELRSVEGRVVGYTCIHCGRLYEAPHMESCPVVEYWIGICEKLRSALGPRGRYDCPMCRGRGTVGAFRGGGECECRKELGL